jgi:hypothetical protein
MLGRLVVEELAAVPVPCEQKAPLQRGSQTLVEVKGARHRLRRIGAK